LTFTFKNAYFHKRTGMSRDGVLQNKTGVRVLIC
jgi:hypothetical protein